MQITNLVRHFLLGVTLFLAVAASYCTVQGTLNQKLGYWILAKEAIPGQISFALAGVVAAFWLYLKYIDFSPIKKSTMKNNFINQNISRRSWTILAVIFFFEFMAYFIFPGSPSTQQSSVRDGMVIGIFVNWGVGMAMAILVSACIFSELISRSKE